MKRRSQHQQVPRHEKSWLRWLSGVLLLLPLLLAACGDTPIVDPIPTAPPTIAVTPVDQSIPVGSDTVAGTLYGQGTTALILSNQIENASSEWGITARYFASRGFSVLTYQYRATQDDTTRLADLQAAITFMQQQGAQKIVLMGASIGGLVTAKVATQTPVQAIVLLSAPYAYQTILLDVTQVQKITAPALVVESDEDYYAADAQKIYNWLTSPKAIKIYSDDDSHGVALFANHDDLFAYVWKFLQDHDATP